jgi:hypothetical protein
MGFETIIALDLGKFNSVGCTMDAQTREYGFPTVATTPAALHALLAERAGDDAARTLVVCETCDAAGWVRDLAAALGFAVNVANCCHEAWRWTKVKPKTDRDDALKLAKMAAARPAAGRARAVGPDASAPPPGAAPPHAGAAADADQKLDPLDLLPAGA